MIIVCNQNMCTGCMACVNVCKMNAISIVDSLDFYNAEINEDNCMNCGSCRNVCPNLNPVEKEKPLLWKEGWAMDSTIRNMSSSGGVSTSLIYHFIQSGGYVAACLFKNGEFVFEMINSIQDATKFVGSKYVKSNPKRIYGEIACRLEFGKKVLFIGLPCQVAALKNIVKHQEFLYTVDLICHGSPSPKLLNLFLKEKGIDITELGDLYFRKKMLFGLRTTNRRISTPQGLDMYTYAFLKSIDYTENCYYCRYASLDRVSDITLGDSWGSEQDESEKEKGISLILCQSDKGTELLKNSGLQLYDVDLQRAVQFNHQLEKSSEMPPQRDFFFKSVNYGFERIMRKMYPKLYLKNLVKTILYRLGISL